MLPPGTLSVNRPAACTVIVCEPLQLKLPPAVPTCVTVPLAPSRKVRLREPAPTAAPTVAKVLVVREAGAPEPSTTALAPPMDTSKLPADTTAAPALTLSCEPELTPRLALPPSKPTFSC